MASSQQQTNSTNMSATEMTQTNDQNNIRKRKRARTSSVWEYYTKKEVQGSVRYACNVHNCKRHFSVRSSTSTLRGHLHDHGYFLGDKQSFFNSSGSLVDEALKPIQQRNKDFLASICHWLVDAGLPFSTVENDFFKEMIFVCDVNINVPIRTTVSKALSEMRNLHELTMKDKLKDIPGMISITRDALSSRIFKGYLSLTLHWVDKNWCLQNVLLDFVRFPTPHNGETTSTILFDLFSYWKLLVKVKAVTADNASVMVAAMGLLTEMINIRNNTNRSVDDIHVRCIAHIVNLAVKDCLTDVHIQINQIRSLLSAMRSSVKRRNIYELTQRRLGITVSMPFLDVPTRWSSTFTMIRNAYRARVILNSITSKVSELRSFAISNEIWDRASTICTFVESASSLTECQSGSTYATLSMTLKTYNTILTKCKSMIDNNDVVLSSIASKMAEKLQKYNSAVCDDIEKLAQVLDPNFGSNLLCDSELLLRYVVLPSKNQQSGEKSTAISDIKIASGSDFMQSLLCEDSLQDCFDDEVVSYLRATAIGDKRADPFEWWRSNERRYPSIEPVAREVLAIPASSVCSEEFFSVAGNMVDSHRTRLSDDSIRSSMLLRAWTRVLRSIGSEKSNKSYKS